MPGSESSGDGEIFDADAARRQAQAHNVAAAAVDYGAGPAGAVELDLTCGVRCVAHLTARFVIRQELWRTTLPSKTTYMQA